MIIIVLLLSISLVIASFFLGAYIWAVKNGQYDDTYSPAMRVFSDGKVSPSEKTPENSMLEDSGVEKEKMAKPQNIRDNHE